MKKTIHRAATRGYADHGWLRTHHTFSFAGYYDPGRIHFGALRVLNDDIMLSYQDTSYHDNATLRELSGRLPAPEFHQWMMKRGLIDEKGVLTELAGDASIFLQ